MKTVTFAELKDNLEQLYDFAHVERIHIREDGEDKVVMLPYAAFEQLRKAKPREAMHVSELPDEAIRAVVEARIPDDDGPERDAAQ